MFDIKQLSNQKIFIDTCSLMYPPVWRYILDTLIPELKANDITVTVPLHVLDELRKLQNREGSTGLQASMGLKAVAAMLEAGILELSGVDDSDTFVDNYILYIFTRLRLKHNLTLITQDKKLAQDIYNLSNQQSVRGQKAILLLKFSEHGLVEWVFDNMLEGKAKIYARLQSEANTLLTVKDTVHSFKYGQVTLQNIISETASGIIYETDKNLACKMFICENIAQQRKKLVKMLNLPVNVKGTSWPVDAVTFKNGDIVGYLIHPATGRPLKDAIFPRGRLMKNYPQWTRKNLVQLSMDIALKVDHLHKANVLLGGVNPSNMLVCSNAKAKIINVDEFQVGNYPCLYIDSDFTTPEIRHKKSGPLLVTREQEYYGLALLIFMILLPGKHPFSPGSWGVSNSRMRLMEFPYPLGEKNSQYAPVKQVKEKESGRYVIIAGHRRKLASRIAGLESVPCVVIKDTGGASEGEILVEHNRTQRERSAMVKAREIRKLKEEYNKRRGRPKGEEKFGNDCRIFHEKLERLGISERTFRLYDRLNDLIP